MSRFGHIGLTVLALSLGLVLVGCEGFDPTAIMDSDFFNTKKRLPGERKAVFPEGTPGVPQGVPKELVKGYEPTEQAEQPQPTAEAAPAEAKPEVKAKPKPKPKVVAKPKDESAPTASAQPAQPAQGQSQVQWPDPPPMQQRPWPDPPPTR